MTKNRFLTPKNRREIDDHVARVLKGLGSPEPPLRLRDVRELLKLDRAFYTADDPGLVREVVSRIRVATIQVARRPMLVVDAIRKWSLQSLYIPDQKRIMLDADQPEKKHRWSEAHEVLHSLLDWHEDLMHGDNSFTLSQTCHEQIETEANFGAGRLLFLQDRFEKEARDQPLTLDSIQSLKRDFGNTLSSTLWRFVETVGTERPLVGMISCHPHPSRRPVDFDGANPCRHFIQSPAFAARFSGLKEQDVFEAISSFCEPKMGGPIGIGDCILTDDNGDEHLFTFECFFIRYKAPAVGETLTLGIYQQPHARRVALRR